MQLNSFAKIEMIRGASGAIDGLRIVAPVKGRGLQTTLILRSDDSGGFGPRRRAILSALLDAQNGADAWAPLSDIDRGFLERSGLFLSDGEMPREVAFDEGRLPAVEIDASTRAAAATQMRESGVAIVRACVGRAALDDMRRYYRALVDEGFARFGGEGGEPRRWVLHNDPLSRAMHPSLVPLVSAIAGTMLKASFSYLIVYLRGATLERHRDRAQCEVTAVLQVDFDPDPQGPAPWPLTFVRGEAFDVTLALGDLVVFRGTEIEHYRDTFACGRSSTSLAFCFVPQGFEGSLD